MQNMLFGSICIEAYHSMMHIVHQPLHELPQIVDRKFIEKMTEKETEETL